MDSPSGDTKVLNLVIRVMFQLAALLALGMLASWVWTLR
jgi:hypothetical protein